MPGRRERALLGRLDLAAQAGGHLGEVLDVRRDPRPLHLGQHGHQRKLDLGQQLGRAPPARSASRASASSAVASARWASARAASVSPAMSSVSWPAAAASPRSSRWVAQGQVGQVEGALAGQRQVGGERGVAGQAAQPQAAGGQRVHRPLGVMQRLRPGGLVGQPVGQRLLVPRSASTGSTNAAGLAPGAALAIPARRPWPAPVPRRPGGPAPGAADGQPDPAAAGVLASHCHCQARAC